MTERLFDGATAAGRLMAATDWASTPVGDPSTWSEALRGLVRTVLSSRYPMLLLWGDELTQLYNDAYSALIGDRHPAAMGNDVRVTLAEGWPVLGPLIAEAVETGVASWVPALQLLLDRAGYREEAYFSVSHAPARDDEGVTRGVLTVCSEVTEQVVGERRLRLLGALPLGDGRTASVQETADRLVATVAEHPLDVPFVGLYLREGDVLRRAAAAGAGLPDVVRPDDPDPWRLRSAGPQPVAVPVPDGAGLVGAAVDEPLRDAVVVDLPGSGVLLAGVSPSRALDDGHRAFFGLLAQQAAGALRGARAYEEERARAEALAELDRAKTAFFTNVSHEFRTPLTLMLGPLTDALADDATALPDGQRERVETALRGAERLLKLVNDLLTFSSVEAGRPTSVLQPVDLAALTTAVASGFRAAVERGGLVLDVDCPPLPRPVVVDPDHWERIVTNLLSNALKFTFSGRICVRLQGDDVGVVLEVADTGVGIPAEALPRLFDRFSRVSGTRARSHEGSGIGLALVRELTALLGGEVAVDSAVGAGTRFTVRVPYGAPADVDAVAAPSPGASVRAAVAEATSWTAGTTAAAASPAPGAVRVLVADDNADMREHLARLLRAEGWSVETVADGREALLALRAAPPDLLLTDVMMPELDGFELLRAVRADPRTATLPVVVLSARAGEGASAEGLDLGADDYVVKPFVSADLVARLRGTLRLARQRSAHVSQLQVLGDAASLVTSGRRLDDALRTITGQVQAALRASEVRVVLDAGEDRPALAWTAGGPGGADDEVLTVPVRGRRGRDLGTLSARLPAAEAVRPEPRALLGPLAGVLAAVVEEAWHAERETTVAATLQAFLLPERLPDLAGLRLAAAYRPAEQDVQVGGDWYDVLELPDGRVALSVGDVAGQGLTSALVMGQLRTAVRAYALEGLPPHEAVAALDDLVTRMPGGMLTTLFLGYLDVSSGALVWCSAGHPPPAVVDGGSATWLEGEVTPPLGAGFGVAAVDSTSALPPDARLVLYTDGLVEDRSSQLDEGMPALLGRLAGCADADPAAMVAAVLEGPGRTDDTAVLVVHRQAPAAGHVRQLRDVDTALQVAAVPQAAGRVRREVRPLLRLAGVDDDVAFELLLGLSEAVNNAVEHPVDTRSDQVEVRVHVDSAAATVRLEVRDSGRWRERRPSMDRGRGATLMAAGASVQVLPGQAGTAVVLSREL